MELAELVIEKQKELIARWYNKFDETVPYKLNSEEIINKMTNYELLQAISEALENTKYKG